MSQTPVIDRRATSGGSAHVSFLESVVPLLAKAAKVAVELHREWGGSTMSVTRGNMAGQQFYAVGTYPECSFECVAKPSWELLFAYAILNANLLFLPNHALGTWYNRPRNLHEIEVVRCVRNLQVALALGQHSKQYSIYDLRRLQEIAIQPRVIHSGDGRSNYAIQTA